MLPQLLHTLVFLLPRASGAAYNLKPRWRASIPLASTLPMDGAGTRQLCTVETRRKIDVVDNHRKVLQRSTLAFQTMTNLCFSYHMPK